MKYLSAQLGFQVLTASIKASAFKLQWVATKCVLLWMFLHIGTLCLHAFISFKIPNFVHQYVVAEFISINQSINQSINLSIYQSINQPTNKSINQPTNQSTNQSINQSKFI